jgi:hypothetical protein
MFHGFKTSGEKFVSSPHLSNPTLVHTQALLHLVPRSFFQELSGLGMAFITYPI